MRLAVHSPSRAPAESLAQHQGASATYCLFVSHAAGSFSKFYWEVSSWILLNVPFGCLFPCFWLRSRGMPARLSWIGQFHPYRSESQEVSRTCSWSGRAGRLRERLSQSLTSIIHHPQSTTLSAFCASANEIKVNIGLFMSNLNFFAYLDILWMHGHRRAFHTISVRCAQNFCHRKNACEAHSRLVT